MTTLYDERERALWCIAQELQLIRKYMEDISVVLKALLDSVRVQTDRQKFK